MTHPLGLSAFLAALTLAAFFNVLLAVPLLLAWVYLRLDPA